MKIAYLILLLLWSDAALASGANLSNKLLGYDYTPAKTCSYPLPSGSNTAVAAYSFRRLSATYFGKAVQLIRASDSATLDIGFDGCDLDSATAAAFCTSTTCRVKTWYDQSGLGVNALQNTAGSQPLYTAACIGSLPCATFDGERYLSGTLSSGITADSFVGVVSRSGTGSQYFANVGVSANYTAMMWSSTVSACAAVKNVSSTSYRGYMACTDSTQYAILATLKDNLSTVYVNGTKGTDNTTSTTIGSNTVLGLGGSNSGGSKLTGTISEMIIFAPDISSTDGLAITANQRLYWGF